MKQNCKRKSISFEEKKKILDDSDRLSTKKLAEKYGKKLQTIRKIKKQREKITNAIEIDGIAKKSKHVKSSTYKNLETAVLRWFKNARERKVSITGDLIKVGLFNLEENIEVVKIFAQKIFIFGDFLSKK